MTKSISEEREMGVGVKKGPVQNWILLDVDVLKAVI